MARGRRSRTVLLCLLVAAALAGCGAPEPVDDPGNGIGRYYDVRQLLAAVSARQHAERTAQLSLKGTLAGPAAMTFTGDGAVRLDGGPVALRLDQTVQWPGAAPQRTGFVLLGEDVWLRTDDAGRPWLRAPAATTEPDRVRAVLATTLGDGVDPTVNLARYAEATLVADASDDTVADVPAVRYTLVVDLARAARLQPDPALRAQLEQQVRDGMTRITSTLWVDGGSRPVRTEQRQELPGMGTLSVTGEYRGWGTPVRIDPPPAAEVR